MVATHVGSLKKHFRSIHDMQVAVDGKSNEITAISKLLQLLDLHGALVTIVRSAI